MSDKPRLKYEKPVSIDMGRVSPLLNNCNAGTAASDECGNGFLNAYVPACKTGPAAPVCSAGTGGDYCTVGSAAALCRSGSGT
jgi:hypothetical protein